MNLLGVTPVLQDLKLSVSHSTTGLQATTQLDAERAPRSLVYLVLPIPTQRVLIVLSAKDLIQGGVVDVLIMQRRVLLWERVLLHILLMWQSGVGKL